MKIQHAIAWFALLSMTVWGCTADEPPDRAAAKQASDASDCKENDSSLRLTDDIVIDEGEVKVEAESGPKDDEAPAVDPRKKPPKVAVANKQMPIVIKIPDAAPLSDEQALAFLRDACLSCHHAETGSVKSFWSMDPEMDKEALKIDPLASAVYYSLVVKAKGIVAKPRAMPDRELTDKEKKDL